MPQAGGVVPYPGMQTLMAIASPTVVNGFAETEITCPITGGQGILIHDVWFTTSCLLPVKDEVVRLNQVLADKSTDGVGDTPNPWEEGVIALSGYKVRHTTFDSIDAIIVDDDGFKHWHFSPPIRYTKPKLYLSTIMRNSTVIRSGIVRIGYTY